MTAASEPRPGSEWSIEDEKAFLRRQRWNERAVQFSSVLSAAAIVLGAALSVYALIGEGDTVPTAPVDPLALDSPTSDGQVITFESARIEARSQAALEAVPYDWQTELPGWTVAFLEPRGRASGYTWSAERHIEVFVREGDDVDRVARVFAHELGHAVDVTLNTGPERRAWMTEREASADVPWWPISGKNDFETGAGDFAEVFAAWQVGDDDFKSKVNDRIDAGDLALMEQLASRQ